MRTLDIIIIYVIIIISNVMLYSCSDEIPHPEQQNVAHTIRLNMQTDITSYGDIPASRATSSWKEGSQIFIYSSSVKGCAHYSDGYWTLNYTGNISSDINCELYYFENPVSADINGAVLDYNSAVYKSTTAKLVNGNGEVTLGGSLSPISPRIRFKDADESNVNIKGVETYTNYTNNTKTFTTGIVDEINLASTDGYTPYLYLTDKSQNQEVTITVNNCIFKRTLNSTQLGVGKSGYFETPTLADSKGWIFVSKAPAPIWDGTVAKDFAKGKGTMTSPYIIESGAQLLHLKDIDTSNKYFKLANDIDLDNKNWLPIPDFQGNLDGNGCTILNLKIHRTGDNIGLFSDLSGDIKNLTIKGVDIDASESNHVGVLAGYGSSIHHYPSRDHTLDNVHVVLLENSKVVGNTAVGGLVGIHPGGWSGIMDILNCSIEAVTDKSTISGQSRIGGIIGYVNQRDDHIRNCSVKASLVGQSYVAGIAGYFYGWQDATIDDCMFNGDLIGTDTYGIAGYGVSVTASGCKVEANMNGNKCYYFGCAKTIASYFCGTAPQDASCGWAKNYSCYICSKRKDGSISAYALDDDGHMSKDGENITTYLKDSYSQYADYWNFNNTWVFEGKMNGTNQKISCPRLSWE